jgi:hypothetical protein
MLEDFLQASVGACTLSSPRRPRVRAGPSHESQDLSGRPI